MKAEVLKKFFGAIFLLTCFLIPQGVSAEKTDFADSFYNFKAVKKIFLSDIVTTSALQGQSNIMKQKLLGDYVASAKKMKREVSNSDAGADLRVECKIKIWHDDYYIIPEHTVWEEKPIYRRRKNSDGNTYEEKYYITVPVTYPPRRVDTSELVVSFEVYDVQTGKMVFGREDNRKREDYQAQIGMFKRMCNSFFNDLNKKMR